MQPGRRDLGSVALVAVAVLALLALSRPVSRTTVTDQRGVAIVESGWFGDLVLVDPAGTRSPLPGSAVAFGVGVVLGLVLAAVAGVLRWRSRSSPGWSWVTAGWLITTGVLVLADTAARMDRARVILAPAVAGELTVTATTGPWLVLAAGVLAAASAAARSRERRPRPARIEAPMLTEWTPVGGSG